ncbi:MAG: Holliday junction resolvase RuvX [Syntrophales bacterium]|nr:Holliday junction resolvase RuvX [Syntrophales bacterium]
MMNIRSRTRGAQMKVLGIDFGDRKIGIAVSDGTGRFAHGVCTLRRKSKKDDLKFIRELVQKEGAAKIVFGLPIGFDGHEGKVCEKVKKFANELREEIGVPIEFVDEVLSTEEAKEIVALRPRKRKFQKDEIDRIAAAIILQRYLDHTHEER